MRGQILCFGLSLLFTAAAFSKDIQKPAASEQNNLSIAPPLPLEPQFPLGLTEANRLKLIDNPERIEKEKQKIIRTIEKRTFPFIPLFFILSLGGFCWISYLTKEWWLPKIKSKPAPGPSPKEQGEKNLQTLEKSPLLDQGLFQEYYAKLTTLLLTYVQGQFGVKTIELTTEELIKALEQQDNLSPSQKQNLFSILEKADQVKFAAKKTSIAEAKQLHQEIKTFIQN